MLTKIEKRERAARKSVSKAFRAFDGIRKQYESIRPEDVEFFAPVYYPIAVIEADLQETSYEDFDVVQKTILTLISLDVKDPDIIAKTLGLKANYVSGVYKILVGYGLVDRTGLTQTGWESVRQDKMIVKHSARQKFEIDALNGTLIRAEQLFNENTIDPERTSGSIGHMDYIDSVQKEDVRNQLIGEYGLYTRQKSGFSDTNITDVDDIRLDEMQYTMSYMIKLKGFDKPVIFSRRAGIYEKNTKNRYSWYPFFVSPSALCAMLGTDDSIPMGTEQADIKVYELFKLICDEGERDISKENYLENAIKDICTAFRFSESGLAARIRGNKIVMNVSKNAFEIYEDWVADFLLSIGQCGACLTTNSEWHGNIALITSRDADVLEAARILNLKTDEHGVRKVKDALRNRLSEVDKKLSLIEHIISKLREL